MKLKTILLILIILIAVLLRFFHLGYNDLWFDEAVSVSRALGGSSNVDPLPNLYYIILKFWLTHVEVNEFTVRLPSAVAGVFAVLLIYKIGKLLFDKNTGIISAIVLSFFTFHIWYSQEARNFSLFTLFLLGLFYFHIKALKENEYKYWILFSFFMVINLYLNYWTILFIPALVLIFMFSFYRKRVNKWLIFLTGSFLFYIPGIIKLLSAFNFVKKGFWVNEPTFINIVYTLENFNLGYTSNRFMYNTSWVIFGGLFIIGVYRLLQKDRKMSLILLSGCFSIPIILTFIISKNYPIYLTRHLLPFSCFYYLIIAYGLRNLNLHLFSIIVGSCFICLLGVSNVFYFYNFIPSKLQHHRGTYVKKPFEPIVKYVIERKDEKDLFTFTNDGLLGTFSYYAKYKYSEKISTENIHHIIIPSAQDFYWRRLHKEYGVSTINIASRKNVKLDSANRIWVISGNWARNYTLDDNSEAVLKWMNKNFELVKRKWMEGIFISLYKRK